MQLGHLRIAFSILSTLAVDTARPMQRFLREPPDQTAKVGEQVTLPCRVENKQGKIQWTRDDFGLGQGRDLTGFDRYVMTGSDAEGDYTLSINPLRLEDDAVFQCQVGAVEGVEPIRSRYATLTVTVPPEPPQIINGKELSTEEGRLVTIECVSRGGKPPAEVTWLDNWNAPIKQNIETIIETLPDGKRQTAISLLRRKISREEHNTNISCEAQNSAESSPSRVSISLSVEFAPHVTLHYQPHTMYEGDSVHFKCTAEANPSDMTFRWYIDRKEVKGDNSRKFVLEKVSRLLHNSVVKCEVRNKIGKSEESHPLNIHYGPVWLHEPVDVAGERGEEVVLTCLAGGNPPPSYSWHRATDKHSIIGVSSNLTVFVTEANQGVYTCRSSVKGFKQIETSARVFLKGPPNMVSAQGEVEASLGERVELVCEAIGVPYSAAILWAFQGKRLLGGAGYSVQHNDRGVSAVSILILDRVEVEQFGTYNCSSSNMYGEDFRLITLKQTQKPAVLMHAAVGCSAGILVTLFILLVLVQYRRARDKPRPPHSVDDRWDTEKEENEKDFLQNKETDQDDSMTEDEYPLHLPQKQQQQQHYHQSPLAEKFNTTNLNVRDPHYSAVYGNPFLRNSVVEGYCTTDGSPPTPNLSPSLSGHHPPPAYPVYEPGGGGGPAATPPPATVPSHVYGMYSLNLRGSVPTQYIIRSDAINSSLATHV